MRMRIVAVLSTFAVLAGFSAVAATPAAAFDGLDPVISEVMFNPASAEDNWEWIEIHNPDAVDLVLDGWVVDDINSVEVVAPNITAGTVPAGGSAILFNADDVAAADFEAAWGVGINLIPVTSWSAMALNNGGDTIGLWEDADAYGGDQTTHANAVISVAYGNLDDGNGSIYLPDLTNQANFALSTDGLATPVGDTYTSQAAGGNGGADVGSPGGVFPPPVVADPVISEVMFNPSSGEDDWEWIELHNPGDVDIDLAGWVVDDINGTAVPAPNISAGTISAGGSAILFNIDDVSAADFAAAWGTGINLVPVTDWSAMALNNGGDTVGLWSSAADHVNDQDNHANANVSAPYDGTIDDGAGSVYLTDLTVQTSFALSTDGLATPVGETYTSQAAGGNSGADVGSPGGTPTSPAQPFPFIDNFTSDDCTDGGWQVVSVDADQSNTWSCSAQFSNADVNGFGDEFAADEWLITPALNMNAQADEALNFDSFTNFTDAAYPQLEVVYSSDYDGAGDPSTGTWTALNGITFSPEGSGEYVASGAIDLSGISGSKVYFAFHYTSSGTGGGEAANWRIDSVEFAVDDGSTEPTAALIHEIQGSGPVAALDGQTVIAQAIVTSLFESNDALDGFFIQEEDAQADADPATSEAVFVFCRFGDGCPSGLAVGDLVTVTGEVTEFNGMSQIDTGSGSITIDSSGNDLPAATVVNLPAAGSTEAEATFENIEGMIVTIAGKLIASEYFNLGRFGEIVLTANERAEQFTDANAPDVAGYSAFLADLATRQIVLDDNNSNQFDARSGNEPFAPQIGGLSLTNKFRGGDSITDLTGVIHWNANAWRMRQIDVPYSFVSENPGTATPDDVGGTLKVASFNVLNYFVTLDNPGNTCGPAGLGCRGANSVAELDRQRAKIVSALVAMDADVVGLIEIENDAGAATADLVAALNAELGAGTYDYVETGTIGTDAIKQAFIYKPATVSAVGAFAVLDSSVDPAFIDDKNRPALIQTFEEVATGARVTVAVNHLKSKGSNCDSIGDPGLNDGQANCNLTRTAAAQALADYLATDPTGSGDADSLIIGDLNAYAMEDPITALEAAGYADMLEQFQGTDAYGYVFDGQLGYLDYAMANADLQPQVTGVTSWHINADEVNLFDYNDDVLDPGESDFFEPKSSALLIYAPDQFRSSDHDPVIVGLALGGGVPRCGGLEATIIGTDGRDRINGTNGPDVIVGLGGNDIINGLAGDDVICGGDGNDVINGSTGDDTIYGELGKDRISGHNGNDYISGGFAADNISGGNGDDMLDGNDGNDRIIGNNGNDIMNGGVGRDVMNGLNGNDTMAGGDDNDRLIGGGGNDGLDGGDGTDNLNGSGGTDTCTTGEVIRSCEL